MPADIEVAVFGAGAVGKSCISIQYIQGHFVNIYDPTVEDVYRKPTEVDGTNYVLTIVDTAGQDTFTSMREQYMKSGRGFVLVYSITDSESFMQVKRLYTQLRRVRGDGAQISCIIVGNKNDLSGQRAVAQDEGAMFAHQIGCPFKEISAKNRLDVEDVFTTLLRNIVRGSIAGAGGGGAAAPSGGGAGAPPYATRTAAPAAADGGASGNGQTAGSAGAARQPEPAAPKPQKQKKKFKCAAL